MPRATVTVPAVIILAGGESQRMGVPKLALKLEGETLLERSVTKAMSISANVTVVVGAYPEIYTPLASPAKVIQNPDWQLGLGSTLRVGIAALEAVDVALVMLADQPFVSKAHLLDLLKKQGNSQADMVFSTYEGVQGPPMVIAKSLFPAALNLSGSCGAKALINKDTLVETLELSEYQDVDTPEDAKELLGIIVEAS